MSIKEIRISRIFNPKSGKAVIIPVDHGLFRGTIKGIEDPVGILKKLVQNGIDATLMSFGTTKITESLFYGKEAPARILTSDYVLFSTVPGSHEGILGNNLLSSVEQAVKWGFDAMKVFFIWGVDKSVLLSNIKLIAKLARECDCWEMPLMVEPLLNGEDIPVEKKNDPMLIENACRISLEIGADILKIPYTGDIESFSRIVKNSHVPVMILGGPKMNSLRDVLQTARDAIDAGAKGVVFGRNVWQHPQMDKVLMALKDIVHMNKDVSVVMREYKLK